MNVVENQRQPVEVLREHFSLVEQLQSLPQEAFSRARLITTQSGCPNVCSFCSQGAGTMQYRFSERGLNSLFGAIKAVRAPAREEAGRPLIADGRNEHRQGVVSPYYDNDVGSYPYLDAYLRHVNSLDATVALSTVGWSRHNPDLQRMHERIVEDLSHTVSGLRFSWTPYTYGWTEAAAHSGNFSRTEMIKDFANGLQTYRPLVDHLGIGYDQVHTEIRFRTLVETSNTDLNDTFINGHHVIQSGPYLLVSRHARDNVPPISEISSVSRQGTQFTHDPSRYMMVVSDKHIREDNWKEIAQGVIGSLAVEGSDNLLPDFGEEIFVRNVDLLKWANADGPYYAVDPGFDTETGEYTAKQFFPRTEKRKKSGYTNTERFFLNSLLEYKRKYGIGPHEEFSEATWRDAEQLVASLYEKAIRLQGYDRYAADYVRNEVIPLVNGYRQALELAGYEPSFLFSSNFTIDTGSSANQGRARGEFRGLAATTDEPMSPWEDRFYGDKSIVSQRNTFWKWSPTPFVNEENLRLAELGIRNVNGPKKQDSVTVSEMHPRTFSPLTPDGVTLQQHIIHGVEVEAINSDEARIQYLLPGLIKREEITVDHDKYALV